jgi:pimeloyl-ACP methyl ester carboxylesterase
MTRVVLVHGAFRGGWSWDRVLPLLAERGIDAVAPTLTGCTPGNERVGTRVRLSEWIDDVVSAADDGGREDAVILVGHSQGGIVTTGAAERLAHRQVTLVHLDAPVPLDGQRGIDLNPPGVPAPPDDLDPALWLPARPVGPEQGFVDDSLQQFVNERLVPTPLGPSLDRVSRQRTNVREVFAFCSRTPPTYPCWSTRFRLDAQGVGYAVLDSDHDVPLLDPSVVAHLVAQATFDESKTQRFGRQ